MEESSPLVAMAIASALSSSRLKSWSLCRSRDGEVFGWYFDGGTMAEADNGLVCRVVLGSQWQVCGHVGAFCGGVLG